MEYIVLEGVGTKGITRLVNEYIGKGWKPQGGIGVRENTDYFYQAMVRD